MEVPVNLDVIAVDGLSGATFVDWFSEVPLPPTYFCKVFIIMSLQNGTPAKYSLPSMPEAYLRLELPHRES